MLPLEHSAILLSFIKLPFVIKSFVLPIFEWPIYTGFLLYSVDKKSRKHFQDKNVVMIRVRTIFINLLSASDYFSSQLITFVTV